MPNEKKVVELDINDVLPNRFQPRIKFDEKSLLELASSIKKYGVINPIVVRKIGSKYEIIAGERRYKASVLAGKLTIPAIISNFSDNDSVEIALIENVQREDLTPIEKAISYKKILDMDYMNQEDLAKKIGKSQSSIANTLRLLGLSDEVQEAILENKISERHARSLLKLKNHEDQVKMLNKIITERLTVRKTDEEIDKMLNKDNNAANNIDEIINIPDDPIINQNNENPGFMDIEKIENQAKDIIQPEKPVADLDNLMKKDERMVESTDDDSDILIPGKFFNFFNDETENKPESENNQSIDFGNNFSENNNFNNSSNFDSINEAPTIEPVQPSMEPVYEAPTIEPVQPSIEPMYEAPTLEPVQPSIEPVYEAPTVEPVQPSIEPMYEVPTLEPVQPSIEPMYEAPTVEPVQPSIEPMYEAPTIEPVQPSIEPVYEAPTLEPVQPSIEPVYEAPTIEPVQPSIEPVYEAPAVEPVQPSIEPMYEAPTIEPVYEEPTINPVYDIPEVEEPTTSSNILTPQSELKSNENTENNNKNEIKNNPTVKSTFMTNNIKTAINTIRDCANTLEKYGFNVDVEEVDFEDSYQVTFKIEK